MKKFLLHIPLCFCLLFITPIYSYASSQVMTGYTADGIYYEAITIEFSHNPELLTDLDYITLTKQVTYSGLVYPSSAVAWTETIDGTTYIGTLYLDTYYHTSEHTTIAIYKGTLYKEDVSLR